MDGIHSYDEREVDFANIDEHANRASDNDARSFDSLITYLKRVLQDRPNKHPQLVIARGILAWIAHAQKCLNRDAPYGSPMNLVLQMVDGKESRVQAYKTFCGHAGIDCRIVTGRAKSAYYRAGDLDSEDMQDFVWNIITTDGQQHLVQPTGVILARQGYSHGGEMVMESDGTAVLTIQASCPGHTVNVFNEFLFCTHPKIFVTRHLPDQPQDQLLPPSEMINSVDDFLALPYLDEGFYYSGLSLMTEKACSLQSNNGKCQINLLAGKIRPSSLNFSYILTLIDPINTTLSASDLPLLVLFSRNQDVFEFEIRFPIIGQYRFYLTLHDEEKNTESSCCEFKINCMEIDKSCKRLPTDSGIEGYGFGLSAEEAGLKSPSVPSGKVYVQPTECANDDVKQNQKITFKVEEDRVDNIEFLSNVYSVDGEGNTKCHPDVSKTTVDGDTCKMHVEVSIPDPGEYSLVIESKNKKENPTLPTKPILKYLVTTDKAVHDNQMMVKLKRRELMTENKKKLKEDKKATLQNEYDMLKTQLDDLQALPL